jgi:hypothetical protein
MIKKYYIGHILEGFEDGGQSRNKAFRDAFNEVNAILVNVYSSNLLVRFFYLLNTLRILLFSKSNTIFIHQGALVVLFPYPILKQYWIRALVFRLIKYTSKRNDLTIEVNDLPYEQAKDLELPVLELYKVFQDSLYSLKKAKYIFASHEMGKYVNNKFKLNYEVIINGSNELREIEYPENIHPCFDSRETKFIYAGGLNKGRQIELLISKFSDKNEILILIGEWGEWLLDYNLSKNIFYLGKFNEEYAHYLTSKCDVGIIPYDERRFYYNICYPTKASFYITAGIPFLSTPLLELKNIFEESGMVFFVPFKDWSFFIENFNKKSLIGIKENINRQKQRFYWKELLMSYKK